MNKSEEQILTDARAIVADRDSWGSGVLLDWDGCYCLLGAIAKASGIPDDSLQGDAADATYAFLLNSPAVEVMAKVLDPKGEDFAITGTVFRFNDRAHRRGEHEKVLNALDEAITLAKETA